MRQKINIRLGNGNSIDLDCWQRTYGLPLDSLQIGRHFSMNENIFRSDIRKFGSLEVNEILMRFLDNFRDAVATPVRINSFNRSAAYQARLIASGVRAAATSPHVAKMAADIDTVSRQQTLQWVNVARAVAEDMDIRIRLGYKKYLAEGKTFIHVDVCPEFYAEGKIFHHKPHPAVWENAISW